MANKHPVSESRVVYWILIVIALLALALLVAGLVTPSWLVMDYRELTLGLLDVEFSMGLWYVAYCVSDVCESKELNDFWDNISPSLGADINHSMIEYRVEAIISVVALIIVMLSLLKIAYCSPNDIYNNSKGLWIVMCGFSAISAACALIAASKYAQENAKTKILFERFAVSPVKFPYSIALEGVGGILAGLTFVIIVIETIRAMKRINSGNQSQNYVMTTYPSGAQSYVARPYSVEPNAGQQDSDKA